MYVVTEQRRREGLLINGQRYTAGQRIPASAAPRWTWARLVSMGYVERVHDTAPLAPAPTPAVDVPEVAPEPSAPAAAPESEPAPAPPVEEPARARRQRRTAAVAR